MKINWKVRFKNWRTWVLGAITFLSIVWASGGFQVSDLDSWGQTWQAFVTFLSKPSAIIAVLAALVANYVDPTTDSFGDSRRALTYDKPNKEDE
ncbi:hypothetical protein MFLO_04195 [Listeria floridensis FSL S10-1187]|uniref:Holin n=1 Tax=Listeria floridensis FSL S10-1187 TaxID=1265817 RepID=A0ABN0RGU5_9LIST|nr:phage holin [Listeria floridensis]EUJ33112.1 hypothetical protein MFLO_04195 [Listeria floridensis FSL S10-1187]